jgi:hypothetical protein
MSQGKRLSAGKGKELKTTNNTGPAHDPFDYWFGAPLLNPAFMRWDLNNVDNKSFNPSIDIHEVRYRSVFNTTSCIQHYPPQDDKAITLDVELAGVSKV